MIYRFDPFRELVALQSEIQRALGGSRSSTATVPLQETWTPVVDIHEDESAFVLYAEIPGVAQEDLSLNLENRTLTISGERKAPEGAKEDGFKLRERTFGRFSRVFNLPATIQSDKIEASFKHGLLTVTLPKAEELKPRLIKVNAN